MFQPRLLLLLLLLPLLFCLLPHHMFLALRGPSVVVFNKLRVAPPSSFATLESPAAPEGSCHNLREYGSERSSEPSGSVMCGNPQ